MSTLGERIKEIRVDKKMTQSQFAEKLSISRPFVSRMEADKEKPSESLLKLISATYRVNFQWLLNGTGTKYNHIAYFFDFLNSSEELQLNGSEKITFSDCSSHLLSIIKNAPIQNNSDTYYLDRISSIFKGLDILFTKYDIEDIDSEYVDYVINRIRKKTYEALRTFSEPNMNDVFDEELKEEALKYEE